MKVRILTSIVSAYKEGETKIQQEKFDGKERSNLPPA